MLRFTFVVQTIFNMADRKMFCGCMPPRTGCIVIGVIDLLALIALYLSPYAYRINQMIALISITPSVLLIIGASLKNHYLMWPWVIINWIIKLGIAGALIIIFIGSVNRDVGPAGVVRKINELVFDKEPGFVDVIKLFVVDQRSLAEDVLRTFLIYIGCTLMLLIVASTRISGVYKYMEILFNENEQEQTPNIKPRQGPMPYTVQVDEQNVEPLPYYHPS